MARITATRNEQGSTAIVVTGKLQPTTRTLVNNYITRKKLDVVSITYKTDLPKEWQ